ncbi:MAG TPA: GNAT family N-acetyltransferase [Steroidobacteraceae bacterium]|jgi:GNAT superfamily N-acetyltransferase|nr:GNAT family N-acetyltransferase [Steroidobacteraceae bacterium]
MTAAATTMEGLALRTATLDDVAAIEAIIVESAHGLGAGDYTHATIEAALKGAFGVDTQLLKDRSYFVAEVRGELAACGGWSFRRTLFGSDARADRDPQSLDPKLDAAKIRAFFVRPKFARLGIGSALLQRCEQEAQRFGFRRFELMATLPGVRLYQARGYQPGEKIRWPLPGGLAIEFVPMAKSVSPAAPPA